MSEDKKLSALPAIDTISFMYGVDDGNESGKLSRQAVSVALSQVSWNFSQPVKAATPVQDNDLVTKSFFTQTITPRLSALFSTGTIGTVAADITAGDDTKFDVSFDDAVFVAHSYGLENPVTYVGAGTFLAQASPLMSSSPITYVGVNNTGALVYSATRFTPEQRRTIAQLAVLTHINGVNITSVSLIPMLAEDNGALLDDLADAVGPINSYGNEIVGYDSTLAITRSSGRIFGRSVGYSINPLAPNFKNTSAAENAIFFTNYRDSQTGVVIGVSNLVDVDHYDDGSGTLASVVGNNVVVHRVYLLPIDEGMVIQYGQDVYNSMNNARERHETEVFEQRNDLSGALFLGYLCVKASIINMTDALANEDAVFIKAKKI